MKERLGFSDWLGVVANAGAGSLVILTGRLVQIAGVAVLVLALWPTLAAVVTWLKTGAWVVPTPMSLAPDLARRIAGSTDWVVVQAVLAWLAAHHVLWTAVPAAVVTGLAGTAVVRVGQARRGRAGDIVSLSLRDEYRVRETWARWRPRLIAILVIALLALVAAALYLGIEGL